MADLQLKFTGNIDRRSPRNEGQVEDPLLRENWLARDGRLKRPRGTTKAINTTLSGIPRWEGRYYTVETGIISPKSFAYTEDGKLWVIDDDGSTATEIKSLLNENAYPRHWLFKTATQTSMYFVEGKDLYKYDGNNDKIFGVVNVIDVDGNSINPIDVIEHKDRLLLISETDFYISKNLSPDIFNDATDSLHIIVGSGKGKNLAFGKLEDKLYIFNTEGIFVLSGDVISALAITFELRLVDNKAIAAARSTTVVEKAILFVAEDLELWSWDGVKSEMLSFRFKLKESISEVKSLLDKAVGTYFNNYYMLSFVEKGEIEPKVELWWDAFENKIDIVRGRNVSSYMKTDATREIEFLQIGRSDIGSIMHTERGFSFDGMAITTKLGTRDITPKKGHNVRFTAFYPELIPTSNNSITIYYLLDGRLNISTGKSFSQSLQGEVQSLGFIEIVNQGQFTGRVRPKINFARGESISFYIEDSSLDLKMEMLSMGIDFLAKLKSKEKTIGA